MTLTISQLTENDIPGMHHEIRNSHGQLKELGWVENAMYREFKNHYRQIITMDDLMVFVIRVNGEVAGVVEVEDRSDSYFIGYWLGVRFRKKGIMTRCVADVIKHDLTKNKPLTARTPVGNTRSKGVLTRLNFMETHQDSEWVYFARGK
jgi:RimJ/RimL family protein N-acetyltransferase